MGGAIGAGLGCLLAIVMPAHLRGRSARRAETVRDIFGRRVVTCPEDADTVIHDDAPRPCRGPCQAGIDAETFWDYLQHPRLHRAVGAGLRVLPVASPRPAVEHRQVHGAVAAVARRIFDRGIHPLIMP